MATRNRREALTEEVLKIAARTELDERQALGRVGIVGTSLSTHRDALLNRIEELEGRQDAEANAGFRLLTLDPAKIVDRLPRDRDPRSFADEAFKTLVESIRATGQQMPILVRRASDSEGRFEIAAGRRRLVACQALGRTVLARVLELDDDQMVALQYRENAERSEVSVYERGVWLARLATERDLSTRALATMLGLSQPLIVEYTKLGRLPSSVTEMLNDPRELTIGQSRQIGAVLAGGVDRVSRFMDALKRNSGLATRRQIAAAVRDVSLEDGERAEASRRHIRDHTGRRLATMTRSGNQWVLRWASDLDEGAIDFITARLPDAFAEWLTDRASGEGRGSTGSETEAG